MHVDTANPGVFIKKEIYSCFYCFLLYFQCIPYFEIIEFKSMQVVLLRIPIQNKTKMVFESDKVWILNDPFPHTVTSVSDKEASGIFKEAFI